MILLLGGTTEGRMLAWELWKAGYPVWLSVAFSFARDFVPECIPVRSGPFSAETLRGFLKEKGIRVIVDATHPFAQGIKKVAREVARELGIPYLLYQRPRIPLPPSVIQVGSVAEALERLTPYRRIFLTIGSKHLAPFVKLREEGKILRVRVLPVSSSLKRCEELGLTPREVVALLGPVSAELNWVLFREFQAEVVVSKDGGREGGLQEKVRATTLLGIPLLLLARALEDGGEVFQEMKTLLGRLEELYGA